MLALFQSILNFIKQPRPKQLKYTPVNQRINIVLQCVIICIIIGLGIGVFTTMLGTLGVYNMEEHSVSKLFEENGPIFIIITAVIIAPILEELIFRAPLTLFDKKYFKIAFYVFAILFGYVHLFNFEITPKVLLFSPILVLPQIVLGLIFGYVRVRFGLLYSMLLHACYNGILIIPAALLME